MIEEELTPLYAQKAAQHMRADLDHRNEKIHFTIIVPGAPPAECVWLDPSFGFFQIVGREEKGYQSIRNLPGGTLFINQRYIKNGD